MRIHSPIHFGPFSVSFVYDSVIFTEHLSQFFSGYECDSAPDFFVKIFPSDKLPPPVLQSEIISIPLIVNKKGFEIGPGLIKGSLALEQKECSITIYKDFFSLPLLEVFQSFLYRMYHTICVDSSLKSYFIHGCGVIKGNTGYLFIGPPKSGKTTIGELSGGLILHDDQIIITLDEKGLTMDSPPLSAKFRHHPNKPCPIEKVFIIVQDTRVSIKPLRPALALKSLYNELVLPLTLNNSEGAKERVKKGKMCFEILKNISMYELHFDKDGDFWNTLTNMHKG
jgi:hypothetical protein